MKKNNLNSIKKLRKNAQKTKKMRKNEEKNA